MSQPLLDTLGLFAILLLRYFAVAGGVYWLCWVRGAKTLAQRRIDPEPPQPGIIRREIAWSLLTSLIFAVGGALLLQAWRRGWTGIYLDVNERSLAWLPLSFALLALAHETYFYWTHRWLHHPTLMRLAHRVHHESHRPTPWTSFSFHPLEALIQAVIIPALVLVIPVHLGVLAAFLAFMTVLGVINHAGYELYPSAVLRNGWLISATHHQKHHRAGRGNYGLYFTLWDRWMGTEKG
jgi:sterol desaturase/sphingolipid hydroxylase (fatty acid hydroxylase superfamily)